MYSIGVDMSDAPRDSNTNPRLVSKHKEAASSSPSKDSIFFSVWLVKRESLYLFVCLDGFTFVTGLSQDESLDRSICYYIFKGSEAQGKQV